LSNMRWRNLDTNILATSYKCVRDTAVFICADWRQLPSTLIWFRSAEKFLTLSVTHFSNCAANCRSALVFWGGILDVTSDMAFTMIHCVKLRMLVINGSIHMRNIATYIVKCTIPSPYSFDYFIAFS
jgi:hypothetical protein